LHECVTIKETLIILIELHEGINYRRSFYSRYNNQKNLRCKILVANFVLKMQVTSTYHVTLVRKLKDLPCKNLAKLVTTLLEDRCYIRNMYVLVDMYYITKWAKEKCSPTVIQL